jgi:hypothetical protein
MRLPLILARLCAVYLKKSINQIGFWKERKKGHATIGAGEAKIFTQKNTKKEPKKRPEKKSRWTRETRAIKRTVKATAENKERKKSN